MKFGIQRRTIYLRPPMGLERHWIFQQLETPEIREMFDLGEGCSHAARLEHSVGRLVLGTIRRVDTRQRIGFVGMRAPRAELDFWEFSYAIPDPQHRDAYSAVNAMDCVAHYMLDHLGVSAVGGWTREDNLAAQAIVRRVGHARTGSKEWGGIRWAIYRLDKEGWAKRLAKLQRGEQTHPSGIGGVFAVLRHPPFDPVVPTRTQEESEP